MATKLFLLLILLSHVASSLSEECHPQDKRTLLQIKKELNNPTLLSSWKPHTNCCDSSWYGVICAPSNNRVYSLLIEMNEDLASPFPPSIGNLPYLESLLLYQLPNLTGSIPRSITKLTDLKSLTIKKTGISGPIPNFMAKLKSLTFLDLSENHLSGTLPFNLFHLPNIEAVLLQNNKLTGSIPPSMARLNSLVVDLSHNRFEGDASVFFGFAKKTETIDLSWNMLAFDMGKLEFPESLKHLDVSQNRIYGKLPDGVKNLEWLNVSYNRLCGEIPTGGIMQALDRNSFSHNKCLCGSPLPSCK
ncbi:putative leucine-rich repeat-containing, plant-type, leucine-rich repeat domain, L [Medicago truncatula]|uniref:Polygalacturonase inhibitor n=1 Tax=Medicago truncatula TaxID=3880 RepID=G7ZXV3_MEDTR|nr:polygalacturonase inhibitor [Medicago truncatula]KEH41286.1 polygalacturonase inhibitor [Medicago truncatula]RHN78808.1 putative leucine-rich repeat-containing, plant-type, leucine-rich repeat domain, L [Medicago truncatula]